ncbi:MAG: RNA 2',3'-cyclic phosphodiesterase [bacterium]|nr:RNA 2',3'-cyclic phosphodiesterase [bacterium]MDT8395826.1 RNA 2',3'-cyclic phosphodiesterase [bacterium]
MELEIKSLRIFLAIPIAPDILEALGKGVETLRETRAPVSWVRPGGMHLTVKFLGDTEPEWIAPLADSLAGICGLIEPFPVSVAGMGAYPSLRRPRVIWAGVEELSGTLLRLHEGVDNVCAGMGWPREKRKFSPHVTVGRVKGNINLARLSAAMGEIEDEHWGDQEVMSMVLYRSHLEKGGARYEEMRIFPFLTNQ